MDNFEDRFPGKIVLHKMCNTWTVKYQYFVHESGWFIFKFENEASKASVLHGGPYFVFGRPLMLQIMPCCFEFDDDGISNMPRWIKLPMLPLDC